MARPKKTDEIILVSILEKYYAEVVCGDARNIRFTDLEAYANTQGITAREYEFRRNKVVRDRLSELQKSSDEKETEIRTLAYKSLDTDGLIRTCGNLSDLRSKLAELDDYWKSIYEKCNELLTENQRLIAERAEADKTIRLMKKDAEEKSSYYASMEKANKDLQRENAYLRKSLERYLYPDLARKLMTEAHLPVDAPANATQEAFSALIEGKQPRPFDGAQKEKEKSKSRTEKLLDEMLRKAEQ